MNALSDFFSKLFDYSDWSQCLHCKVLSARIFGLAAKAPERQKKRRKQQQEMNNK